MLLNIRFVSQYSMLMGYLTTEEITNYALKHNSGYTSICDINIMAANYDICNTEARNIVGITLNVYLNMGGVTISGTISIFINNIHGYYKICRFFNASCVKTPQLLINFDTLIDNLCNLTSNDDFSFIIGNKGSILHNAAEKNIFHQVVDYLFNKLGTSLFVAYSVINHVELRLMELVFALSKEVNIITSYPIIHINKEHAFRHIVLRCIKDKLNIKNVDVDSDSNIFGEEYSALSINDLNKMYECTIHNRGKKNFGYLIERVKWTDNTQISNKVFTFETFNYKIALINKTYRMFNIFISKWNVNDTAKKQHYYYRLLSELTVYDKINIYYFVYIVQDFIAWAKSRNILVGPGRGSCVGSLVIFILNITTVDPVKHDLLFERFLNEYRFSEPDIDIDICAKNRDLLFDYIKSKYQCHENSVNVVHIMAFLKFVFKSAVKDIARVYGNVVSFNEINKILAKVDSYELVLNILTILKDIAHQLRTNSSNENLKTMVNQLNEYFPLPSLVYDAIISDSISEQGREIFKNYINNTINKINNLNLYIIKAQGITGCIRGYSMHPSGLLISYTDLSNQIMLYPSDNDNTFLRTQADLNVITRSKILKYDILGLDTLSIVNEIMIKCNVENIDHIILSIVDNTNNTFDDVYQCINSTYTKGIFQMDNRKAARLISIVKIKRFSDIVALNALNRPGTVALVDKYVRNKSTERYQACNRGCLDDISETDKVLAPITMDTHGVILFQEQIMLMAHKLLKYNLKEADILRYAIGKKKADIISREKDKFYQRCLQNNISSQTAGELFALLESFSKYAFNKSHAVAYSYITVLTAYLKFKYTTAFFETALDNKYRDKIELFNYLTELLCCLNTYIVYVNPNINYSKTRFKITQLLNYKYTYLFIPLVIINNISEDNIIKYNHHIKLDNDVKKAIYKSDIALPVIQKMFNAGCFAEYDVSLEEIKRYSDCMKLITKKQLNTSFLFDLDNKIINDNKNVNSVRLNYRSLELRQVIHSEVACYDLSFTKMNIVSLFFNVIIKKQFVRYLYIALVNIRGSSLINIQKQYITLESSRCKLSNIQSGDLIILTDQYYHNKQANITLNITDTLCDCSNSCIKKLAFMAHTTIEITFLDITAVDIKNLIIQNEYSTENNKVTTYTENINFLYLVKLIESRIIIDLNGFE